MVSRAEIEKKPFGYDDLVGQPYPKESIKSMVHMYNSGKGDLARKAMLLYGDPGLGKDLAVDIIKYQIEGAVVFDIPKGFATRKPNIWAYLFDITYEYSATNGVPVIIYFNECDGTFSKNVDAIKRAWQLGAMDGGHVLVLGSTNNIMSIDGAVKDRFGKPFEFIQLTVEQRRVVLKGKILANVANLNDEAKQSLESAEDAQWDMLAALIPQGTSMRHIVVELIPEVVSRVTRKQDVDGRKEPISLTDFINHLQNQPPDGTVSFADTQQGELVIVQLKQCFEVLHGDVMNIRDVLKGMRCSSLQNAALVWAALDLDWKKFIAKPNTHVPPEVQIKLAMCMEKAFPETYGGPRGPKTGDPPVSIYSMDEEWRMKYNYLHGADEQMVKLCLNPGPDNKVIGHDAYTGKELKYSKYFSNLAVKGTEFVAPV